MLEFLSIDPSTIDLNVVYIGLIISLWVGVTAAYIPGTIVLEGLAIFGFVFSLALLAELPVSWIALLIIVIGVGGFIVIPFIEQRYAIFALTGLALQAVGTVGLFTDGSSVSLVVLVFILGLQLAYHQLMLMPILRSTQENAGDDKDNLLIGAEGKVVKDLDPTGTVSVNSELWTATSDEHLSAGERIVVLEREGLHLIVESTKRKRASA